MAGMVLAFSGGLGSGKSDLTKALAERLRWPRVGFGDYVRKYAVEVGRDATDRAVLQQLGQALVLTDREGFITNVLKQNPTDENLIVDGVRHVEILLELKRQVYPRALKLIHLNTDNGTRQERLIKRDHVERRVVARYDSDITEAQIARILPQYADFVIDGSLPTSILVEQVVSYITNWMEPPQQAIA
jgi:dephospho-CoA kinase